MSCIRFPQLSTNANEILLQAEKEALSRAHKEIRTEHVAYALSSTNNRAVVWIASQCYPNNLDNALSLFREEIRNWLENRPLFTSNQRSNSSKAIANVSDKLTYSESMQRVLNIANQLGSQSTVNSSTSGFVYSEFLLAAMLIEGTCVGAEAFTRTTAGEINTKTITEAINLDFSILERPDISQGSWIEFFKPNGERPTAVLNTAASSLINAWSRLKDVNSLPLSSTETSNWIIPDRLTIGEHPNLDDVVKLVDHDCVDTFVSLIGEYNADEFQWNRYPNQLEAFMSSKIEKKQDPWSVAFLHFPIKDFDVVDASSMIPFINELKRRIFSGSVLYIHCRGGHGRTGMVVIPLLCAIYDISFKESQDYVLWSTRNFRRSDLNYAQYVHMPETEKQVSIAKSIEPQIRKISR